MPPAPPTFSTTTCWPSSSLMRCAMTRPIVSCGPPAANGITIVTGRVGKSCAVAWPAETSAAKTAASRTFFIVILFTIGVERCAGSAQPSSVELTGFDHVFGKLVQTIARAIATDQVIVAQPVEIAAVDIRRMDDDIHVLRDGHGLVVADEGPLHQVVALAMTIEPGFGGPAVFPHEIVEGAPDVLARRAGYQQIERELAGRLAEIELIFHRLRHLGADDAGPSELCVHAARTIVLDQQRDLIALLDDAV